MRRRTWGVGGSFEGEKGGDKNNMTMRFREDVNAIKGLQQMVTMGNRWIYRAPIEANNTFWEIVK